MDGALAEQCFKAAPLLELTNDITCNGFIMLLENDITMSTTCLMLNISYPRNGTLFHFRRNFQSTFD